MAICPHCEKTVELALGQTSSPQAVRRETAGKMKKEVMYSCPHCGKVLGFAFFFGGVLTGRP
ncbi:MAG: hypothetical protein HUU25_12315 [Candidatus Sumerlaeia bacterium]|nr:hypothetical protein [Candidatus Sumerlaeia bacterium]